MQPSVQYQPKETIANTVYPMSDQEMIELAFHLQYHHSLFNKFFAIGRIYFDMSLPTAAVYASRETGEFLGMKINPMFWAKQNIKQRCFIIAHELIHILQDHLNRLSGEGIEQTRANVAADLVDNHMCVEKFGFKRSEIDPEDVYCWIDKFFPPEQGVMTGETMEYYYDLLDNNPNLASGGDGGKGGKLVDSHESVSGEAIKDFMEKMGKVLSPQEKSDLESVLAGTGNEGLWEYMKIKVKKKKKWETVIKQWAIKTAGLKQKVSDQWTRTNRRLAGFANSGLFLPFEYEEDLPKYEKKKIKVHFYLDTSGSCHHLAERFFTAAKSLPEDRFDIRLFCFHDYVVETDITGDKVHKGGGTAFDIIEKNIQEIIRKEGDEYPRAVFVVTDGMGNNVVPDKPERWHWFLSAKYMQCIPKESKHYMLDDFE